MKAHRHLSQHLLGGRAQRTAAEGAGGDGVVQTVVATTGAGGRGGGAPEGGGKAARVAHLASITDSLLADLRSLGARSAAAAPEEPQHCYGDVGADDAHAWASQLARVSDAWIDAVAQRAEDSFGISDGTAAAAAARSVTDSLPRLSSAVAAPVTDAVCYGCARSSTAAGAGETVRQILLAERTYARRAEQIFADLDDQLRELFSARLTGLRHNAGGQSAQTSGSTDDDAEGEDEASQHDDEDAGPRDNTSNDRSGGEDVLDEFVRKESDDVDIDSDEQDARRVVSRVPRARDPYFVAPYDDDDDDDNGGASPLAFLDLAPSTREALARARDSEEQSMDEQNLGAWMDDTLVGDADAGLGAANASAAASMRRRFV